jgi:competence protein ComEC
MLLLPVPGAARWGGLFAALGYALLSGWGVPAQRTVWMLAAVTLLQASSLAWPWPLLLLAAACIVTAFDSWALLQPGFWLSFGAVGLLLLSQARPPADAQREPLGTLRAVWRWLAGAAARGVRTQLIATLGLTPLTLVFFQQVSLVGFAANLIAIPLVTLVITPLALLGVVVTPLWTLGAWVTQVLVVVLGWLAALPGAVWTAPAAPAWAQLAALGGAGLLVMPLPWRARMLALPLALPLLIPPQVLPEAGRFELMALDVGQGTAVLVRTRGHLLLYDAGPQYSRDSDAGQRVLLPLLRGRGETNLDTLVLSHRDSDHIGGARALLAGLPVSQVLSSLEVGHPLRGGSVNHHRCAAGQTWEWDAVRFDVLRPTDADYGRAIRPNGLSCVLRVSDRQHSVLLTGDIEREQELDLVASYGDSLRSDVLIVPHHGSRTSSTPLFLDAVRPRIAVFQAGYRNRFGHPAAEVIARYAERGIVMVDSPRCGAWAWGEPDDELGRCLREATQRYWRHDAGTARLR